MYQMMSRATGGRAWRDPVKGSIRALESLDLFDSGGYCGLYHWIDW